MLVVRPLATGVGPFPELGWAGIALGTAIGHCCGAAIILVLLATGRAGYHLRLSLLRPDWPLIKRILRIGVPGGIDVVGVNACHLVYLRMILQLGDIAAAAHGIAIQVEAIGFMPGGAFQIAASTLTGQYLGARDFRRAKHDMPARVERLEYDPNRTAFIALLKYNDGTLGYILAPQRLAAGDTVVAGAKADVKPGADVAVEIVNVEPEKKRIGVKVANETQASDDVREYVEREKNAADAQGFGSLADKLRGALKK